MGTNWKKLLNTTLQTTPDFSCILMWIKQFRSIITFHYFGAIYFPIFHSLRLSYCFRHFFKIPENISVVFVYLKELCSVPLFIEFSRIWRLWCLTGTYWSKRYLQKKRAKSLEVFLEISEKTATNHLFSIFQQFSCYIKENQHKENLLAFLIFIEEETVFPSSYIALTISAQHVASTSLFEYC